MTDVMTNASAPSAPAAISPGKSTQTRFDAFLQVSVDDPVKFSKSLLSAARELRAAELGLQFGPFVFQGDRSALVEINQKSLRPVNTGNFEAAAPLSIPAHLKKVSDQWEKTGTATLYRGTRLPDTGGSFGFGVHATPQIDVATGYATGEANSSTGIGRLLKTNKIGFISAYEMPLDDKTYKNFQFEDALTEPGKAPVLSLRDLQQSMRALALRPENEFSCDAASTSDALNKWDQLASKDQHYEMVLDASQPVTDTYLVHTSEFIKINANDPKWDQLLARVQEASLRDFYEVQPLERASQALKYAKDRYQSNQGNQGDQGNEQAMVLIGQVQKLVDEEKSLRINAPWEAVSLKDVSLQGSIYLDKRSHILQSVRVGSAMQGSSIVYPEVVAELLRACQGLQTQDTSLAALLIKNQADAKQVLPDAVKMPAPARADLKDLSNAIDLSVLHAQRKAGESIVALSALCNRYAAGSDMRLEAYEEVSRSAYLAAFDVQTYGETCAAVNALEHTDCEYLCDAGKQIQARALAHEHLFLAASLSPSQVFYDDLLNPEYLVLPHEKSSLTERSSNSLNAGVDALARAQCGP